MNAFSVFFKKVIEPDSKAKLAIIIVSLMILSIIAVSSISIVLSWSWIDKKFPGFLVNERMVIANFGALNWTGTKANLRFPDKIISADGIPVNSGKQLMDIIASKPLGFPVVYEVQRAEGITEVIVPSMQFKWTDFILNFGSIFLSGILFIVIGVVVFSLKFDTQISWAFLISCFCMSLLVITTIDNTTAHFGFIKIYLIVNAFTPATFLHFSFYFPTQSRFIKNYPFIQYIPYLIAFFLAASLVYLYPDPRFIFYWYLVLAYMVISSISVVTPLAWQFLKSSSALARQRAKVVLFGAAIAFPLPALVMLLQNRFGHFLGVFIPQNHLGIPLIFFPASIAYAIIKHNLFDVDIYIKRTIGYVIMTGLVATIYFFIQTSLNHLVLQPLLGAQANNVSPIIFALLVVFLFNPLNSKVQALVDRLFYRSQFDYKEMVLAIGNALSSVLSLPEIVNRIITTVRRDMFIETTSLIILQQDKEGYLPLYTDVGKPDKSTNPASDKSLSPSDPIIRLMEQERKMITFYDLEEDPHYQEHCAECRQRFQELDATLALPLISHDQLVGILLVGKKKSGKFYTREEIDLLRTLANEGAVALQNARLLEENLQKSRMDEELRIARGIQMSMLPDQPPEIKGFSIAAKSYPAREVGGDFYDFIELGGEEPTQVGIVVGDVSGKAISGALVMAASRSVLRVLSEAHQSIQTIMNLGNARLCSDVRKGMFVALLYAIADSRNRTLTLSNAGQTQPILCPARADAPPAYIETEGDCFPLGIIRDCEYLETRITLQSGDTVAFYTDGIVEASNAAGELYGFERLVTTLGQARDLDADALLNHILDDVNAYVGDAEQHDDITLVILKVA